MWPQVQDQRSSSRGDQPQRGQRMRGPEGLSIFSSSSSRSKTTDDLATSFKRVEVPVVGRFEMWDRSELSHRVNLTPKQNKDVAICAIFWLCSTSDGFAVFKQRHAKEASRSEEHTSELQSLRHL